MIGEAFYAAAAGVFPLLVVAIVVAVSFKVSDLDKLKAVLQDQVEQFSKAQKTALENREDAKRNLESAAELGDPKLLARAVTNFETSVSNIQFGEGLNRMLVKPEHLSGHYRRPKLYAWSCAAFFAAGEVSSFSALAFGRETWLAKYGFAPLTIVALLALILMSAESLIAQALHSDTE